MDSNQIMAVSSNETIEAIVYDKSVEFVIAQAEKQSEAMKKILGIAVKRTNPSDWTSLNDKPYLGASGCEKVFPLFGGGWRNVIIKREEREDEKGKHYIYTSKGDFYWKAGAIEAIGSCSSRDKFFGYDSKDKSYKELHDVDEPNIQKASFSNMIVNGVTRLLGIRNLQWSDLEPFGISKDKVVSVDYNKGANTGGGAAQSSFISELQRKRLLAIATKSNYNPETLKEFLMFNFNISSTTEIPWKKYDEICKKVETEPKETK